MSSLHSKAWNRNELKRNGFFTAIEKILPFFSFSFCLKECLCLYVYVCAHVHAWVCVYMYLIWKPEDSLRYCSFTFCPSYFFFFFTTECFAGLGLTEETVPESSKGLPGSASPGLSVHVYTIMPALFRGDLGTEFRSSWFHGNHFNNGTMIPAP